MHCGWQQNYIYVYFGLSATGAHTVLEQGWLVRNAYRLSYHWTVTMAVQPAAPSPSPPLK